LLEVDADWNSVTGTVDPAPENREVYDELYSVYRDLYPAINPRCAPWPSCKREENFEEKAPT
jgi:xylulokinase